MNTKTSNVRRIFELASRIHSDRAAIWEWLMRTPIESLGGKTAVELLYSGEGGSVVSFLDAAVSEDTKTRHV